ncbi:MAG: TIGR04219 family outer membrane beta-barrel protein [Marinobacter sp.]|nr:TIGR04219 family outer membrane beta-barrel protein [Marinobacter sp.]
MRKLILMTGAALVAAAPLVSADVVGFGASVSYWDSQLSGKAVNKGDAVDVENELNLSNDSTANLTAYIEHPIPVLPNVRLNYTRIQQSGQGNVGAQGYENLVGNTQTQSDLDLKQIDVTLYYELLDNWVNLDLGLTARSLDGDLVVRDRSGLQPVSRTHVKAVVPMGYISARFDLPFTGVSVGAEGNGIAYSGDSIYDLNAYGQYEMSLLRLRAGYRQQSINYEDNDNTLDIKLGGPFVSAGLTF